jgi:hypothetical protein
MARRDRDTATLTCSTIEMPARPRGVASSSGVNFSADDAERTAKIVGTLSSFAYRLSCVEEFCRFFFFRCRRRSLKGPTGTRDSDMT